MAIAAGGLATLFVVASACLGAFGLCDHLGECEVGLILGSNFTLDGDDATPTPELSAELDRALALRRLGYFDRVIITAGGTPGRVIPQIYMRKYLVEHGVPEDAIIVDRGGINLASSARNAVMMMRENGWDEILVITEFYRVPRARLALERYGAHDVYSATVGKPVWNDLARVAWETVAYPLAWFRHYERVPGAKKHPDGL